MEEIKKMLIQVLEGQEEIKIRLDNVEKTVIKIENEHGEKIEALLDGYKQNSEQLNTLNDKVDDLQADVNNLTIRTLKNENTVLNFSKTIHKKG